MLICRNAEGVHGPRKFGNLLSRTIQLSFDLCDLSERRCYFNNKIQTTDSALLESLAIGYTTVHFYRNIKLTVSFLPKRRDSRMNTFPCKKCAWKMKLNKIKRPRSSRARFHPNKRFRRQTAVSPKTCLVHNHASTTINKQALAVEWTSQSNEALCAVFVLLCYCVKAIYKNGEYEEAYSAVV